MKAKKILIVLVLAVMLMSLVIPTGYSSAVMASNIVASADVVEDIGQLFFPSQAQVLDEQVYLGGYPLGMTIDGSGVTVIGLNEFVSEGGELCCPAINSGIGIGDTIIEVEGVAINNSTKLADVSAKSQGRALTVVFIHDGKVDSTTIEPLMDITSRQYRMGLWTRDSSSGIGTLTFFRQNLQFASLGHPICDSKGNIVKTTNGKVFYCDINGVKKGQKGCAGELKGHFDVNKCIGDIHVNHRFGVYGNLNCMPQYDTGLVDIAGANTVKTGKAQIFTTVNGNRESYDIEIVKVNGYRAHDDKGMVIKITDDRLLDITGGIVQGMSGSPILQDGCLIGAVTHVFVNDPTRGYGIFIGNMLEMSNNVL